jgi:hypothetical protein
LIAGSAGNAGHQDVGGVAGAPTQGRRRPARSSIMRLLEGDLGKKGVAIEVAEVPSA